MKEIEVWVYTLINPQSGEQAFATVNEPSDNICIGVTGLDGKYHQYDSYEAYHMHAWACAKGLVSMCEKVMLPVPSVLLPNHQKRQQELYCKEVVNSKDKIFHVMSDGKEVFVMSPDRHEAVRRARTMLHCKHHEIDYCRIATKEKMLGWIMAGGYNGVIKPQEME